MTGVKKGKSCQEGILSLCLANKSECTFLSMKEKKRMSKPRLKMMGKMIRKWKKNLLGDWKWG